MRRHKTPKSNNIQHRRGFTIVELLIVIVVIGILASIVIVAYNGIQQKARVASLQSDMSNAASQLGIDNVNNGNYPADAAAANDGQGLKASTDTTYQYTYTSADNSYCLTGTNSSVSYFASTTNLTPQAGACSGHVNGGGVVVATLAGSGTIGFADGTGTSAQFSAPRGLAVDGSGMVYVADYDNNRIRKVSPSGVVTTLAGSTQGSADGTGTSAQFYNPYSAAVDSSGTLYVTDHNNSRIRKVSPSGVVTTLAGSTPGFADGTGSAAKFSYPVGVAVDSSGTLYVGDYNNHRIRKVSPSGVVTTLAGSGVAGFADGAGAVAQFYYPVGVAVDSTGAVYVADSFNNRIRKVSPSGVVTTFAGSGVAGFADGAGTAAKFDNPYGVAVDSSDTIYVADLRNNRIRQITSAGVVTTLAGSGTLGFADGAGTAAMFNYPRGVAIDSAGTVYVADTAGQRIRTIK